MGTKTRKYHSASLKAKVALEAVQERETINQIASQHGIHPNMVTSWKKQLIDSLPDCFSRKRQTNSKEEDLKAELYEQIGRMKIEIDFLKKKSTSIRS